MAGCTALCRLLVCENLPRLVMPSQVLMALSSRVTGQLGKPWKGFVVWGGHSGLSAGRHHILRQRGCQAGAVAMGAAGVYSGTTNPSY